MSSTNCIDDGDERCAALARVIRGLEAVAARESVDPANVYMPGDELFLDPFGRQSASSR
jgi:hypothetical protein